jgi:hypothetical protein
MTPAGASVLLPSEEGCQRIVDALFSDQQLSSENAVVEVRDGSDNDIGDKAVELLSSLGFPAGSVVASDPPEGDIVANTEIVNFTGKDYSAGRIADWLGVPASAVRAAAPGDDALRTTGADIVVVLGADADVTGLSAGSSGSESQ